MSTEVHFGRWISGIRTWRRLGGGGCSRAAPAALAIPLTIQTLLTEVHFGGKLSRLLTSEDAASCRVPWGNDSYERGTPVHPVTDLEKAAGGSALEQPQQHLLQHLQYRDTSLIRNFTPP